MSIAPARAPASGAGARPVPSGRKPDWRRQALAFGGVSLFAALLCYILRGEAAVWAGLDMARGQFFDVAIQLALGLLIAALISVLLPRDKIARWLGEESGFKGLGIATVLGALMPGAPLAVFPIVAALSQAGARNGTLVAFLASWAALSVSRLFVWEIPLLGLDFGLLRMLVGLPLPFLAGLLADQLHALALAHEGRIDG